MINDKSLFYCQYCQSQIFLQDRVCPRCGAPTINFLHQIEIGQQMKESIDYKEICPLDEINFIAGTEYNLEFKLFTEEGIVSLNKILCVWNLYDYGKEIPLITRSLGTNKKGIVNVKLLEEDTYFLQGTFVHTLSYSDGKRYKFGPSGIIKIWPSVECY